MVFDANDTIVTSQTVTYTIKNAQKYPQNQYFSATLTTVSGSPSVAVTAYGQVTSGGSWVQIGSPVTWTTSGNNPIEITSTSPIGYNTLKVTFVASGATQKTKITSFTVKTTNAVGSTITGAVANINVSSNNAVNIGTGTNNALISIGGGSNTLALNSSKWAITSGGVFSGMLRNVLTDATGTKALTAAQTNCVLYCTYASGATTVTIPDPSAATIGVIYYVIQTANQNLVLTATSANSNSIVCDGVATSDNVTISTSSHKIGAGMIVIGISATQWYVGALNPASPLTPEAAD